MKDDLIRRETIIRALDKSISGMREVAAGDRIMTKAIKLVQIARDFADNLPAVDAVEVVRCLYCIHAEMDDPDFPDDYYCHAGCGWNKADFFCAYAERREDDAHLE